MQIGRLFLENIKATFKMAKYCIKVHGGFTDQIQSLLGLKQGCLLSPLLFNLLIDDIKTIFNESCDSGQIHANQINHLLYADDLILISSTAEGLQNCLNQLSDYCLKWDLSVNISKSKVIVFNKSGKILKGYKFSLDRKIINMVQSYCYLGIDILASASFGQAISELNDKAGKAMFPLINTIFKFDLNNKKSIDLFHRLIAPIILYGQPIHNIR